MTSLKEGKKRKGKLILVSNREPYSHHFHRGKIISKMTGGSLVSVLDPLMQEKGNTWVAWGSGKADFNVTDSNQKVRVPEGKPSYWLRRIKLSKKEVNEYYIGFSNRVLWPLVHLMIDKVQFNEEYWNTFKEVNERFANITVEQFKKNDLVWVQDYHLSLVPNLIRKKRKKAKIAFFFHLPWPPWEVFRILPWGREILKGILGADLIGFHTKLYARNFLDCVRREFRLKPKKEGIKFEGRNILCKNFPLGIDFDGFQKASELKKPVEIAKEIRKSLNTEFMFLGIDRLDYSKGIPNKLRAFNTFLKEHPSYRKKVVLVQLITPPRSKAREYKELEKEIDILTGEINGSYQKLFWVPIRCLDRFVSKERLLGYYRASDALLVTPLIDGMNLVAKEFIASRTDNNACLILSDFAGAAEELNKAIKVNPFNESEMVEAMRKALTMKNSLKRKNFKSLKKTVQKNNVFVWLNTFLNEWENMYSED